MNLLALDTSTGHCSVVLWNGDVAAEREAHAGQAHSELLLAMVDAVLAETRMTLRALDGIAFGRGPGAFTGLRIACGISQGLAYSAGIPVAGVDTLQCMAEGSGARKVICSLDARMGEVYHAAYIRGAPDWETVHAPSLCAPDNVPAVSSDGWLACGSGFSAYAEKILPCYTGQLVAVDAEAVPHARDVARLAAVTFARGQATAAARAAPLYVRDKVALKTAER